MPHRSFFCSAIAVALFSLAAGAAAADEADTADQADEVGVGAPRDTAPPPETGPPTWYAQALARGDAGLNVTHFWSKGPLLRAETVISGHKIVTIVNGEWYYAFDGLLKRGMAIRRQAAAIARDAPGRRPFGNEYEILLEQGAEKVGEEVLLGRPSGIFRVTDRGGRRELWVTLDEARLPLRVEIFERSTGMKRYTDYINWRSALYIPDAFFEADSSVEFERLDFDEYVRRSVETGPVGPVPVLYSDLLRVKRDE
jgi:hypothetical protein